jgi:hypothetical protein
VRISYELASGFAPHFNPTATTKLLDFAALLHLHRLLWLLLLLSEIQRAGERSGSNAANSGICPYGGAGLVKSGLRPGGRHTASIEPFSTLFH